MKIATSNLHYERVLKVQLHIQNNLDNPLTIENLSEVAHYSPYHFQRIFAQFAGTPMKSYILILRLQRAAMKLIYSTMPISSIAYKSGYTTHEAFTRAFKTRFGQSPSQFRLRHAKTNPLSHTDGFAACRDRDGTFFDITTELAHKFGFSNSNDAIGKSFSELKCDISHVSQIPLFYDKLTEQLQKPIAIFCRIQYADKSTSLSTSTRYPLYDRNGNYKGIYHHGSELTSPLMSTLINNLAHYDSHNSATAEYQSYLIEKGYNQLSLTPNETECLFYTIKRFTPLQIAKIQHTTTLNVESSLATILEKNGSASLQTMLEDTHKQGLHSVLPANLFNYKTAQALKEFAHN